MAKFLLRYKNLFSGIFILVSLLSLLGMSRLRINFSFDKFFPEGDEQVQFFRYYEKLFPQNDRVLYLAIRNPAGSVFDADFLRQEVEMRSRLSAIPFVDSVFSIASVPEIKRTALGFRQTDLLRFDSPEALSRSREKILEDHFLRTTFISLDEEWMSIFLSLDPSILDAPERDAVYDQVKTIAESYGLEIRISGIPGIRTEYIRKVRFELALFVSLSILIIIVFLFRVFRTWWGMLFPLLGVVFPVIWLLGLMGWLGMELDLLTTLLPSLLFVVGTSDIIHLLSKFLQEFHKGSGKLRALFITIREIGWLTFLTSFSTAVSLGSLYLSPLKPVQDFGVYASLGVMLAFLITYLLVPPLILLLPDSSIRNVRDKGLLKKSDAGLFGRLWQFILRREPLIVKSTLALAAVSMVGAFRVDENVRLLDDLGSGDVILENMRFFEDNFTGVRYLEVVIQPKVGTSLTSLELLQDIDKMAHFLEVSGYCHAVVGLPDIYKRANQAIHFNRKEWQKLPATQEQVDEITALASGTPAWGNLIQDSAGITRITARMRDLGSYQMQALEAGMHRFAASYTDTSRYSWRFTGTAILFEQNNQYLTQGLFSGLLLSTLIIAASMATLFFSWRVLILALLPNILPILVLGGVMGFSGISLKASTVIVIALCFGIAFDDTIHFLGRLKLEMQKGYASRYELIGRTLTGCGEGLVLTTLVLCAGFLILVASDFGGTFYIGLFSCVTLIVALGADLFLLPILILRFFPFPESARGEESRGMVNGGGENAG